jgi:hypothetical protein
VQCPEQHVLSAAHIPPTDWQHLRPLQIKPSSEQHWDVRRQRMPAPLQQRRGSVVSQLPEQH